MSPLSHDEHFLALDALLTQYRDYWQGVPFDCLDLPWRDSTPGLCDWLDAQSLSDLQAWKAQPVALAKAVSQWLPEAGELLALCEVTESEGGQFDCDSHWSTGVPGRKWEQISAFNRALPYSPGKRWLEWCAGKGYLGCILAVTRKAEVTSLEWQDALCVDGQAYATKHKLPMRFVQGDAFASESKKLVDECDHAVALHACGDLHVTLLRHFVAAKAESVTVSPCCYHLIQDKQYQPLSSLAKQSSLVLSKHDLKLPLQETVTAGQTVKNKRFVEVSYRLGFDALQRSINPGAHYLPVPNVQKSLLKEGFEAFCFWAAEQKGLTLDPATDFAAFQQLGESRFLMVERMETVRTLFRRPLEMWLVYDRALYLQQHGFETAVTTFCARELTPRNILISATRKG
ncbi:methyltransferase [Enterovibrio paralichthyis]|uniref:methyltransferase n=1 Tax=Enterovibrio paralichthyis TaxID=2853805 RepID=UPI00210601D0|nr:methyltransferase [Enterovibrio paralichthyis]